MSTEANQSRTIRRAPMILGVILIGIGATAAMAAQTGLSFAQSASICLLVCAIILFAFLLDRTRSEATT